MNKFIVTAIASVLSFTCVAEQVKQPNIIEVSAAEYNIRVGEKLRSFGWQILNHGTKYCDFRGMGSKHLISADVFADRQCPDILIGVSRAKIKQQQSKEKS